MKNIIVFRDGIAFRFWHHYDPTHGTAIRWHRGGRNRLIGIRFLRDCEGIIEVQLGLWKYVSFDLCAVHSNRFHQTSKEP